MQSLSNLNLVSVGIAVAAIAILGFVIYFNNRKSVTNKAFLLFALFSVLWSIINYIQYQTHTPMISFWILRFVLFLGVWHSFSFFQFAFVFPEESIKFPKWFKYYFAPLVAVASLATLSPLVFSRIAQIAPDGTLTRVDNGPAIPFVALLILISVVGGIFLLIKKTVKAPSERKRQFALVMWGMLATFLLLMIFNFILPAFFGTTRYIPFGAIFLLPFVALTFYAVSRYHLLDTKVISTEILSFVLAIATLLQIIISQSLAELLLRSGVFVLTLIFAVLLIQSVRREVEQREQLEVLNTKLDDANKQLEELSHFKSELLSLASHQIRSPLAAIKGFGTLIVGGSYGPVPDKIKETVVKMSDSANNLINLINTLLDMRKVEEGKMDYQMARTDLKKLANDVVELLKGLAETKKLEFTFTAPDKEILVNADAEKLKQVIQNLTDNAIKYTPNGFVHVELKEEPSAVPGQAPNAIITVSDSGVGFSPELAPHLFEEFIRDARVKKQILGTGLGLYIARKIAEAHGGTIWAESAGEGKGSSFHMKVPEI
jgi:signal transduction histidine kinase